MNPKTGLSTQMKFSSELKKLICATFSPRVSLKKNVIAMLGKVANPKLSEMIIIAVRLRHWGSLYS